MLLGRRMTPSPVTGWRFVEGDLHDIASRVREYDPDARLVREDQTGHLGLARWFPSSRYAGTGGHWLLARTIHDLTTDLPMRGEPDGRVIRFMRATDMRGRDLREWHRRLQDAEWRREARQFNEMHDTNGDLAERFMNAMKKDVSARPRAFIPRGIPKAA